MLLVASAGCIEQKDPPEHGEFTIEVDSQPLFITTTDGEELHGAHAHVETDLHHDHPEYAWDIQGVGEFEGSEVHLPAIDEGLHAAIYNMTFYEQEGGVSLFLAAIEKWNGTYAFVADGGILSDPENSTAQPFKIAYFWNLISVRPMLWVDESYTWNLLENHVNRSEGLRIDLKMDDDLKEETEYVVGFQWGGDFLVHRWSVAIVIHAGEVHNLTYEGPGLLNISIHHQDDPTNITYQGNYTNLPNKYKGHIGTLHWEGKVGEEETPGLGLAGALVAMTVAFIVLGRRRGG
jgi:hypothetical protein